MASTLVLGAALSRGIWIPAIGRSLVCEEQQGVVQAILVDNLDTNYGLFERAARLQREGSRIRILVLTASANPDAVVDGVVEIMARAAQVHNWETVKIGETEPISLNAAMQVRSLLVREDIRSVALVTPGFRSRRSSLAYRAVLSRAGIAVVCVPVLGQRGVETWMETWHGIQEVALQFLKLQYYRFYVLPRQPEFEPRFVTRSLLPI